MTFEVPGDLVRRVAGRPPDTGGDGDAWLADLPRLVADRMRAWTLEPDGPAMNGRNAVVLPVTRADSPLALKISWPHREADHEHLGLRHWAGDGVIRLVAAEPASCSLLLERAGPDDLSGVEVDTACEVIGDLLGRLHVSPPPTVPSFAELMADRIAPLREHPASIPRRWIDRALEIVDRRTYEPRLLHLDLHFANVLAAAREPWLAIDPKPVAGPAGFDVYPAMRNRVEEYGTGPELRWQVRQRLELVAEAAGIDVDDARAWSLVHGVLNAYEFGEDGSSALTTLHLAIVKTLDDP